MATRGLGRTFAMRHWAPVAAAVATLAMTGAARGDVQITMEAMNVALIGGIKVLETNFERVPEWKRVLPLYTTSLNIPEQVLNDWVAWAQELQNLPARDRLVAINRLINEQVGYLSDFDHWGKSDFWEAPTDSATKLLADCEGYAVFKMYLGSVAGLDPKSMGVLVGTILSTGEGHAILYANADGFDFLLDNRTGYVIDIASESDFLPQYMIHVDELWIFPN